MAWCYEGLIFLRLCPPLPPPLPPPAGCCWRVRVLLPHQDVLPSACAPSRAQLILLLSLPLLLQMLPALLPMPLLVLLLPLLPPLWLLLLLLPLRQRHHRSRDPTMRSGTSRTRRSCALVSRQCSWSELKITRKHV